MKSNNTKQQLLDTLYNSYSGCKGCHFKMPKATRPVWGEGNLDSPIMLIGEAPGREEDIQGRPFVGRSGKLLSKVLDAVGSARDEVFITSIVKFRPPNNRRPTAQEIEKSRPLLFSQIGIIKPRVICTLGSTALESLLGEPIKITKQRGIPIKWHGLTIMPTFHPAYILRNPKKLAVLVADIKAALQLSRS